MLLSKILHPLKTGVLLAALLMLPPGSARADDWIIGSAEAAAVKPPAAVSRTYFFAIAPQRLETALEAYAAVTGIQILYDSHLAANRISPGISGPADPDVALYRLLSGTSLAPVHTTHDVVTVMLQPGSVQYVSAPPIVTSVLPLSALYVEAPPLRHHGLYATTVRFAVQSALQSDRNVREANYHVDVNVWLSPTGSVQRIELLALTGDLRLDRAIANSIRRIVIGQAPPPDLPQPVHLNIGANGAG